MMRLPFTLLLALTLLLAGCTKNEFTVQVDDAASVPPVDLKVVYYASDAARGWLVQREIPAGLGHAVPCPTRYPTLGYVLTPSRMLTIFWAERGDRILLHYRDGFWIASGNDVTDAIALWQAKNRNIIQANAVSALNKEVADFVRKNPDKIEAAVILHTYFKAQADPALYRSLRKLLKGDAADERLVRALGQLPLQPEVADSPVPTLHLRALGDSLATLLPQAAPATVYLFWNDASARNDKVEALRKALTARTDIRVADINMQADTLNWRHTIATDSVSRWLRLWAPGAEQNSELLPLNLPGPDYIIVADRNGRQVYRGPDASAAAAVALKQH